MATTTSSRIRTSLDPDRAQQAAAVLQPTLVELVELALTGKQLHWSVVGERFKVVHEHLDELIAEYRQYGDEVAERLATLGIVPDGRAVRIAGDSTIDPVEVDWIEDDAVLDLVADRIETVARNVRERIPAAAEADPGVEDLLIQLVQVLDKQLWMVSAQARTA